MHTSYDFANSCDGIVVQLRLYFCKLLQFCFRISFDVVDLKRAFEFKIAKKLQEFNQELYREGQRYKASLAESIEILDIEAFSFTIRIYLFCYNVHLWLN